jgi:2-polyprenyl-6-methoxyphenol hydroxylase-like FAD-dependent oxidoreductase
MSADFDDSRWDVIVIGAGVAGAAAAAAVADRAPRARVLLLERAQWPRAKVCGCCLNRAGVALLEALGVGPAVRATATSIHAVAVHARGARVTIEHPGGLAIDRSELDGCLVEHAKARRVVFRSGCAARVTGRKAGIWRVRVSAPAGSVEHSASAVLVADGLVGRSLDGLHAFETEVARSSWMGVGGSIHDRAWLERVPTGAIQMHLGGSGYVGLVRLKGDCVVIASAIDPRAIRRSGGLIPAMQAILRPALGHVEIPSATALKGTALLTRRRSRLSEGSLLVIGDAAGYVEPFTGEGMTWALAGAVHAADMVAGMLAGSLTPSAAAAQWPVWHRANIASRQRTCSQVCALLRRPMLSHIVVGCAGAMPMVNRAIEAIACRTSRAYEAGATA